MRKLRGSSETLLCFVLHVSRVCTNIEICNSYILHDARCLVGERQYISAHLCAAFTRCSMSVRLPPSLHIRHLPLFSIRCLKYLRLFASLGPLPRMQPKDWPKRKFKFNLKGAIFHYSDGQLPVEEFSLQSHFQEPGEETYMRENLASHFLAAGADALLR